MNLPSEKHLIVGGTVKGGTTSLYDYLSRHPEICPSRIKETGYFLAQRYGEPQRSPDEYLSCFAPRAGQKVTMEATPGYLDGGEPVARAIREAVPEARLVFVLRDPVERCVSFLRFKKAMLELPETLDLASYVERCQAIPIEERRRRSNNPWWGVDGGYYARSLGAWFSVFPAEQIRVLFFDELAESPHRVLAEICGWLGLPDAFTSAQLEVENKTRMYRSRWLHSLALQANRDLEAWLRRHTWVKAFLRRVYYTFNERAPVPADERAARSALRALYAQPNLELVSLLRAHGYGSFPDWLQAADAHG